MTTEATRKLQSRPEGKPAIVKVGGNVYVAVNYDVSFMSMIEGPEGLVLVDTGATPAMGAYLMNEFHKISEKPLKAVIFTHSHPDHTGGAAGALGLELARRPGAEIRIWARSGFGSEFQLAALLPQAFAKRGARQFGAALPPGKKYPPLGPRSFPDPGKDWPILLDPVRPNRLFDGETHCLDIAGLRLELHAAPGETSDQMFVWMADQKIMFAGDNIYGSFPNLYAVRGSGYRDVAAWAASIKKIRDKHPAFLVMGHTEPLMTPELCEEWLSNYYEAIKYVFDATIEGMNKGLTADELAYTITLPEHLASREYLTPYYGNVPWAVRSIFSGHLGWFDGDPRKLWPLAPAAEASHMADLAGGRDKLMEQAEIALQKEDAAWAAQLVSYVLALDPDHRRAREINIEALELLGENTLSTSGRNYLLSCAQEQRAELDKN